MGQRRPAGPPPWVPCSAAHSQAQASGDDENRSGFLIVCDIALDTE